MFDFIDTPLMAIYFGCAAVGGIVLLLQLALALTGFGGGGIDVGEPSDFSVETDAGAGFFKIFSIQTMICGIAFFGIGGLIGLSGGLGQMLSFVLALALGSSALYGLFHIYSYIGKLKSDGSIREESLEGCLGEVYLSIPESGAGKGKVLVTQQGRTMEYEATSTSGALKTGTPIVIERVLSSTSVEVRIRQ